MLTWQKDLKSHAAIEFGTVVELGGEAEITTCTNDSFQETFLVL